MVEGQRRAGKLVLLELAVGLRHIWRGTPRQEKWSHGGDRRGTEENGGTDRTWVWTDYQTQYGRGRQIGEELHAGEEKEFGFWNHEIGTKRGGCVHCIGVAFERPQCQLKQEPFFH